MTTRRGRPSAGVVALVVFFAFGTAMATLSCLALLFSGSALDGMWRLNPEARVAFRSMGSWALPLLLAVAVACALATVGLWRRARWGHRLAVGLIAVNLLGDVGNALLRDDLRTLVGLPIGGLFLAYLLSRKVRAQFRARPLGG